MGVDIEPGNITEKYEAYCPNGTYQEVKKDDIIFYNGCLINNSPYPVKSVFVEEAEEEPCSECGISSPCTIAVEEATDISDETRVCNHCLTHMDSFYAHNATLEVCQSCPKKDCSYNPKNPANILALPPGKDESFIEI